MKVLTWHHFYKVAEPLFLVHTQFKLFSKLTECYNPLFSFIRPLYNEPLTPSSNPSLSPGGSPLGEGTLDRSAVPSPADWSEFINASNSKVERDLAQLTLSDPEQRELYEAARLVQTAFRKYKVQTAC